MEQISKQSYKKQISILDGLPLSMSEAPPAMASLNGQNISLSPLKSTHSSRLKQVWAVGGGKGGVGKSLVASCLSISLARLGHKVVAIDLDLGGANLHTSLGVELPKQTLGDYFTQRVSKLEDCITFTGIPNLYLISGAQDSIGITNIRPSQKTGFLDHVKKLDADYIILDLGAGTYFNTVDFFLFSDVGIITILPEPTSIENSYRFIKTAYYRFLLSSPNLADIRPLIEMAMDPKNPLKIKSPADLFREITKTNPAAGIELKKQIEKFRPLLLLNQARTQTDVEIGNAIKTVCKKYFGIEMEYVGYLDYDSFVWQAVRKKRPLMLEFPNSRLVNSIAQITQTIFKKFGTQKLMSTQQT
jgi:flagellar biosynthesis protein FlhG